MEYKQLSEMDPLQALIEDEVTLKYEDEHEKKAAIFQDKETDEDEEYLEDFEDEEAIYDEEDEE